MNNINNSNIGVLNTGRLQAESIDLNIGFSKKSPQNEMTDILKQLKESLLNNHAVPENEKNNTIELISLISEEAVKLPEQRKKNLIFNAIDTLGKITALAVNGKKIWDYCRPYLISYFS